MYRQLAPCDAMAVRRHYLSLCPRDRALRFGVAKSDEAVARYCASIDWNRARLIGFFAQPGLRGLLELSTPLPRAGQSREGAIVVAPEWRRRGVGRLLMRTAVDLAQDERCERLLFFWDSGNDGFALFLAACGGIIDRRGGAGWIDPARAALKKACRRSASRAGRPPVVPGLL
jgi:GNAT superfamily N-acetyltransferase